MKKIAALLLLFVTLPLMAEPVQVENLRLWAAPDHTRLVFDTTAAANHKLFTLDNPDRLVIDIPDARLKGELPLTSDDPVIRRLRSAERNRNDLRVVADLKGAVKPKSFVLKPNRQYGHRLVVDLFPAEPQRDGVEKKVVKLITDNGLRDVVIAIDPGHGGEDPGAKGARGSYEKDVVLAIGRRLEALIERERGMRPVMVRKGDYFLGLRKRMQLARDNRADLFISIHADAFRDPRVRGSSVYTLSRRGASSEAARWLASRENSADLIGGVTLDDKDDMLASVLLDLSQTASQEASLDAANMVFRQLRASGETHKKRVQQAGFAVLKSPDVPSLLIETAFISNPTEERKLNDPGHQQRLAEAIMNGVRSYFRKSPPPGTWLAQSAPKRHRISRGDTLSGIAEQYRISLNSLRSANQLRGDRILVGQVLRIPET
ncbi:MAG: AMIN domain-containing protein [gamma proteobacterium symbiont of Phacoides pectinatus]